MTASFGRAQFGQSGGSHGLLDASGIDEYLVQRIRWHTDLPHNPSGGNWTEFYAGYALDGHFVVQRTIPDLDAGRSGMVSSFVAVVDIAALAGLSLSAFVEVLGGEIVETEWRDASPAVDALALAGTCYLTEGSGYLDIVSRIWRVLNPADRARFVFGRLFTATDHYPATPDSLRLFGVSPTHVSRFPSELVVARGTASGVPGPAARAAFDSGLLPRSMLAVADPSIAQFRQIGTAHRLLDDLDALDEEDLRSLTSLVGLLAPGAEVAATVKENIAKRLHLVASTTSFEHVRGLRTLPYGAFATLDVKTMVGSWVRQQAECGSQGANELLNVIRVLIDRPDTDQWSSSLVEAITAAATRSIDLSVRLLEAALREAGSGPFEWVASATGRSLDEHLAPKVTSAPSWLSESAVAIDWPSIHAVTCSIEQPSQAWTSHLSLTHTIATRELLAGRMETKDLVDAAATLVSAPLIELAGLAIVANPQALLPARPNDEGWLRVWDASRAVGVDPWSAVDPHDVASSILDRLLAELPTPEGVVEALASSSAADVSDYHRRKDLWLRLSPSVRDRFKKQTALSLSLKGVPPHRMEPALSAAMVSAPNIRSVATIDIQAGLTLLKNISRLGEEHVKALIVVKVSDAQSERLGTTVAKSGSSAAARAIVSAARSRPDLRLAARRCEGSLSILDRIRFAGGSSRASSTDVAAGFIQVACQLYSEGPSERDVWMRAGGDAAELPSGDRGRERWNRALKLITNGATGAPSLQLLIERMSQDFPNNADLKTIKEAL